MCLINQLHCLHVFNQPIIACMCLINYLSAKGFKVNTKKTKTMISKPGAGPVQKTGKYPCSVCSKGVGSNSIQCTKCKQWVHALCSRVKGKLTEVKHFVCNSCSSPPLDMWRRGEYCHWKQLIWGCPAVLLPWWRVLSAGGGAEATWSLPQGVLGRSFVSCFPSYLHVPSPWRRKAPSTKHVWDQCYCMEAKHGQ